MRRQGSLESRVITREYIKLDEEVREPRAPNWSTAYFIVVKYGQYFGRLHWRKPVSRLPWWASLFTELHQEMLAATAVSVGCIKFYRSLLHCITFDSILLPSSHVPTAKPLRFHRLPNAARFLMASSRRIRNCTPCTHNSQTTSQIFNLTVLDGQTNHFVLFPHWLSSVAAPSQLSDNPSAAH